MEEDMIQLRLGQQAMTVELAGLKRTQDEDRKTTQANHKENRDSIHHIREDMQEMADNVGKVASKIDDYLLVQETLTQQAAKAWWKQPLGTAVIVAVISVAIAALEHVMGWK